MPNLIFPLLYRNKALLNHQVQLIVIKDQMIVSAGSQGELVIFQNKIPQVIIFPNLSNAYGKILQLGVIQIPLYKILDRCEQCLITLHEDRRIRIFDCKDGRCVGVSAHESAGLALNFVALNQQNCRFIILSSACNIALFDLWRMQILKTYECKVRAFCQLDPNTIAILDQESQLHLLNLSPFNNERYVNYIVNLTKKEQIEASFEEMHLKDGLKVEKLETIPASKIRYMSYNQQLQHLTLVTYRQLYLYFEIYDKPWCICINQSKNNHKFVGVNYTNDNLYITTKSGSVLTLLYIDILYLLKILKEQSDFVYGFMEFQYTKIAGSHMSRLQVNLQQLIPNGQQITIQQHTAYQFVDNCLIQYDLTQTKLDLKLFAESDIIFQGIKQSFNNKSDLIKIDTIAMQMDTIYKYDFKESYKSDLMWNLGTITSPQFQKKYLQYIDIQTNISSAFINEQEENAVYWFGCEDGNLYGFPTIFQSKSYFVYKIQIDSLPIVFVYQKGKHLMASSKSGQFIIIDIQLQEYVSDQSVEYVNLEPTQRLYFPSYAKKIIHIHRLENESYEDCGAFPQQFKRLAILMENNVILIIGDGSVRLKLHGIGQQEVLSLYYEEQADQWFIINQDEEALVYDYKGRYLRTLKIEQYHSLFQVEKKLTRVKEKQVSHNVMRDFCDEFQKSICDTYNLLEFQQRHNYIKLQSPYPSLYEVGGQFKNWQFNAEQAPKLLYLIDQNSATSARACKFVETSIGEMEWWDLKKQSDCHLRLFLMIHPWEADENLSTQLDQILKYRRCTFSPLIGIQSMGYCVSFALNGQWDISSYITSLKALCLMHYYLMYMSREAQTFNKLMVQTVEMLTKKKQFLSPNFKLMDIFQLAQYAIDEQNEVMNAACNLILSQIKMSDQDMQDFHTIIKELLSLRDQQSQHFSNVEVILLIIESYLTGMCAHLQQNEAYKKRVISGIHLKNAIVNPHLCAPLLKVFVDVHAHFKTSYNPPDILKNLFFLFFHYNTVIEYDNSGQQQQQLVTLLREISKQSDEMKKRLRQLTVKAIIQVAIAYPNDFNNILKKDIVNLETHVLYPSAVIEIIRNYIKSHHNNKQLPFLMDVILKSLDPNNPNLRKVCHRSATSALQTICKTFKCVCFHQQTQKIAIGDSQIIIYDLRTAVKWRVLDGHSGQINCLDFDSTGKQLASFSDSDWKIKLWKVGSTGFFGTIIGIQGKPQKEYPVKQQQLENVSIQWSQERVYLMQNGMAVVQI